MEIYRVFVREYYSHSEWIDTDLGCFSSLDKAEDFVNRMQEFAGKEKNRNHHVIVFFHPVSFNDMKASEKTFKLIARIK